MGQIRAIWLDLILSAVVGLRFRSYRFSAALRSRAGVWKATCIAIMRCILTPGFNDGKGMHTVKC